MKGALIQGHWYVHILSLLGSMCIGTCMFYVQPLGKCMYYMQPLGKCMYQPLNSLYRYVHIPRYVLEQKLIKFRGCLEAASEHTNVPLSSAHTWTLFHHPLNEWSLKSSK